MGMKSSLKLDKILRVDPTNGKVKTETEGLTYLNLENGKTVLKDVKDLGEKYFVGSPNLYVAEARTVKGPQAGDSLNYP